MLGGIKSSHLLSMKHYSKETLQRLLADGIHAQQEWEKKKKYTGKSGYHELLLQIQKELMDGVPIAFTEGHGFKDMIP